jgi:NifU-like protein
MAWEYSDKTMQLFNNAVHGKPGTHLGEITDPDGLGEHGSIACGDALRFTFRVKRDPANPLQDVITEAKYLTFGCTSAIAASEALCCMIEAGHLTPVKALTITNQDIVNFLDGLPEQKIHCSVMGAEALQAAVFNWAQKRGVNLNALGIDIHAEEQEEGRVVCKCFTLTEPYLKRKIKELNLHSIAEITGAVKAGGACMTCHHASGGLQDLLNEVWGEKKKSVNSQTLPIITGDLVTIPLNSKLSAETVESQKLSPFQFAKKIEKLLDEYLRPMVQKDGGDLELVDIKETTVYIELHGTCVGCAGAGQTLKYLIERTLKEKIDERIRVIQV